MKIILEESLQEYMKANGHQDLVLYVKASKGSCCSGSFLDVKVRFAQQGDEQLLNQGYESIETELGKVYYHPEKVAFGKHPKLILNQFLGMTIIQALGIGAVDQNHCRGIPV